VGYHFFITDFYWDPFDFMHEKQIHNSESE
jgi:hypothetical protein